MVPRHYIKLILRIGGEKNEYGNSSGNCVIYSGNHSVLNYGKKKRWRRILMNEIEIKFLVERLDNLEELIIDTNNKVTAIVEAIGDSEEDEQEEENVNKSFLVQDGDDDGNEINQDF